MVVFTNLSVKSSNYYTMITNSVMAGFPGIIIEDLFMDNTYVYRYYLSTPENVARLGEVDVLAAYYNLPTK